MSAVGQKDDRGGGSHRIFISWLKEVGLNERNGKEDKLRYVIYVCCFLGFPSEKGRIGYWKSVH